ncbi:MAG: hypothetical protein LBL96_07875 [Clostridiales bacterium]|jgi:hypothetical protein|nr:hypothetical protein [Clostridiales bacterium]
MLSKKTILLLAAATLTCSLGLGASYAWFTSRARLDMKSGLYGDKSAIATYGSLNLQLEVKSYLQQLGVDGVSTVGTPFPIASGEGLFAYPGSVTRVDANGNVIDASRYYKSIMTYTITNQSQAYALAMIAQSGVAINGDNDHVGDVLTTKKELADTPVPSMLMNYYVLLGADLDPKPPGTPAHSGYGGYYPTLEEFVAKGPTWFRYDYGFGDNAEANDIWAYVNVEKMLAAGFDIKTMMYDADAKLTTSYDVYDKSGSAYANKEVPLYTLISPAAKLTTNEQFNFQSAIDPTAGRPGNYSYGNYPDLTLTSNTQFNKLTDCKVFSEDDSIYSGIYLYMPPKGVTTFVFELSLTPGSSMAAFDNLQQFSFYKMPLVNLNKDDRLSVYGIEPIEGAVKEYFNGLIGLASTSNDLWDKLRIMFGLI